jgi:hypothetical protein
MRRRDAQAGGALLDFRFQSGNLRPAAARDLGSVCDMVLVDLSVESVGVHALQIGIDGAGAKSSRRGATAGRLLRPEYIECLGIGIEREKGPVVGQDEENVLRA